MKRREFIKKTTAGTLGLSALSMSEVLDNQDVFGLPTSGGMGVEEALYYLERVKEKNITPEVRPEIKNNPHAVFLFETHVDAKKDESGHFTEAVPQLQAEGNILHGSFL